MNDDNVDIHDIEIGTQVISGITCCGTTMRQDDNLLDCLTCRSTVDLGLSRIVEDITRQRPASQK